MASHEASLPAAQSSVIDPILDERLVLLRAQDLDKIIYALFHDCFVAIQHYRLDILKARGERWVSFYNRHSRYLSLGIASQDLTPYLRHYEYYSGPFISILFKLRALVVFPNSRQRKTLTKQQAETERKWLLDATDDFLELPPKFNCSDLLIALDVFRACLCRSKDLLSMVPKLTAAARMYFDLPPLPRMSEDIVGKSSWGTLSPRREFALIHDIFHALSLLLELRHDMIVVQAWISFREDNKATLYAEHVDKHAYALVVARDVLCGAFAAPTMLEADGAFALYVKPLINVLRSSGESNGYRELQAAETVDRSQFDATRACAMGVV